MVAAGPPATGSATRSLRHHDDRQLGPLPLAEDVVHVPAVELAVVDPGLEHDRPGIARGDLEAEVDDLPRARGDLLVVERNEDVLGVAAVDPIPIAVEHVHVDEVREGVDGPVRAHAPRAAEARAGRRLATSSTQISFESAVPWLNGWPSPRVRTTTSTR